MTAALQPVPEPTPEPEPEAPPRTQYGQLVECFMEDGTVFTVRVTNRDRIARERTAAKHKWPSATDAPNLAMTFVCWSAAKRDGLTALTFELFEQQLIDYEARGEAPAPPYPVGSTARLYAELSVALSLPFEVLEAADDALIATYLEILDERAAT